jgi:TonB family protein
MLDRLSRVALAATPLVILTVAAAAAVAQQPGTAPAKQPYFAHENTIRRRVVSSVMPAYPEAAKQAGVQGLAAALVTYDETGVVVQVKLLAAPDESIGQAVMDALKQWTFAPPSHGNPQQGTLRFNFSIEGSEARVEYGPIKGLCQQPGRTMPDGSVRWRLEDIDSYCRK